MSPMIGQMVSRVVAVIVAALVAFVGSTCGVEVTEEQRAGLESGLTALGGILLIFVYGLVRPLISRWISPVDSAQKEPPAPGPVTYSSSGSSAAYPPKKPAP